MDPDPRTEPALAAVMMSIETHEKADLIAQENKNILEEIHHQENLLDDLQYQNTDLSSLREEIFQKRQYLIALQRAIFDLVKNPKPHNKQLASIPVVINRINQAFMHLSDEAIAKKSLSVPVIDIVQTAMSLAQLHDNLVEASIFDESPEERRDRLIHMAKSQKLILENLQKHAEFPDEQESEQSQDDIEFEYDFVSDDEPQ